MNVQPDYDDLEPAYDAVQALFSGEEEVVEEFIAPVEELDADTYTGDEPMSEFEKQFQSALFDAYNPDETREENGDETPLHGYHLANDFLKADTYEAAEDVLDRFAEWTKDVVTNNEGDATVIIGDLELESEQYKNGVVFHSFRRLVQQRYNYLFSPQESGRNIDLSE